MLRREMNELHNEVRTAEVGAVYFIGLCHFFVPYMFILAYTDGTIRWVTFQFHYLPLDGHSGM